LTPSVALEAIEKKCNIIIEHHPSIFNSLKKFDLDDPAILAIKICIENNIAVYSAHTNIDKVKNGLNYTFMKKIGANPCENFFNLAVLPQPSNLKDLAGQIKKVLCDDSVFFVGNAKRNISKIYCVNGAGGNEENLRKSIIDGADVFISSEFKHHVLRFAKDSGYAIISTSHFCSESTFSTLLYDILSAGQIPNVLVSKTCVNPITKE
jgi:GTP cyclohydrolase I